MNKGEFFAAKTSGLRNGEMKEVQSGETKILLAKVDDNFYAVGAVCPHYKAPLIKGALCGTKLYCPWHHSVFDITDGTLLQPPAIDDLPHYKIRIQNDDIFIQLPEEKKEDNNKTSVANEKTFVILGGGAAGLMAAETLRSKGFGGQLILITKENEAPYDRTALSKKFMSGKQKAEELPLRKDDFFERNNIELEKNKTVTAVHASKKTIQFTDGSSQHYDAILIATGSEAKKLNVQGSHLPNVFTLRSAEDAKRILTEAKKATKVCIIGASFIGMETAASLKTLQLDVTVLAKEMPFEEKFGKEIGEVFYKMHTEKGVVIKTGAEVKKIEGDNKAEAVILKSGERIETELVIVGIGVHPETDFLQGVTLNEKDRSVMVDEYLQAADNVFAAGDIARFPNVKSSETIRIEHWRLAQQHGRMAALNMLGEKHSVHEIVPFFWTNQFDKRLSYVGHAESWDRIEFDGDIQQQKFLAFYIKDDNVLAVASMNQDEDSDRIEDMMLNKKTLSVAELKQKLNG